MAMVTVRGRASEDAEPDRVRLLLAVQAEAVTGADALERVTERSAAAEAALDEAGDVVLLRRPAGVTLSPVWSNAGEVTAQAARRTFAVEARAVGPLGELLVALVAVPGSTVDSVEWIVEPANPVNARLRAAAVQDARQRAADYAEAAGLQLGALEWITEPEVRPGDPGWIPHARTAAQTASLPGPGRGAPTLDLRPEPVAVTAAVDVRFALLA